MKNKPKKKEKHMSHKTFMRICAITAAVTLLACILPMFLTGCGQSLAKNYGGTYEMELPANRKLMEVTWKDNNLWLLTRPMRDGEEAEEYEFMESSNYGVLEGSVVIHEIKK